LSRVSPVQYSQSMVVVMKMKSNKTEKLVKTPEMLTQQISLETVVVYKVTN